MFSVRQPLPLLLAARRTLSDPDFSVLARTIVMMFANQVVCRHGKVHVRSGKQQAWPADRQAEVLYAEAVALRTSPLHIRAVRGLRGSDSRDTRRAAD